MDIRVIKDALGIDVPETLVTADLNLTSSSALYGYYTNRTTTVAATITLPSATRGKRLCVVKENRGYGLSIDCQFSDRFEDYPNGVDMALIDNGYVIFECIRAGVWSTLSSRGLAYHKYVYSRPIYLATTGSDSNDGLTVGTPKQTLRGIQAIARPGDTVNVAAGTYSGTSNEFTTANLPLGTPSNRISFICSTAFGARFPKFELLYTSYYMIPLYQWALDFTNLVFVTTTQNLIQGHDLRFFKCGFIGGTTTAGDNQHTCSIGGGSPNYRGAVNVLLEDCVAFGTGGRYKFVMYNAKSCLGRRCVARWEQGWDSDSSGIQASDFGIYDSSECEFQNCISIDDVAPATYPYTYKGAFFMEQNYYEASDIAMRGCIVVNNKGPAFVANSLTSNTTQVPSGNTHSGGTPPWNAYRKMRAKNWLLQDFAAAKVLNAAGGAIGAVAWGVGPITIENATVADLNKAAGVSFDNSSYPVRWLQGSTLSNCVSVYGAAGGAGHYGVESCVTQVNNIYYADLATAATDGLYHLPMSDYGSTIGALFAGAEILKRIGASGTRYGEPGYRQIGDGATTGDLWPFPNEAAIKALFIEFEAATTPWTAGGSTLTEYVWGILGNAGPP